MDAGGVDADAVNIHDLVDEGLCESWNYKREKIKCKRMNAIIE